MTPTSTRWCRVAALLSAITYVIGMVQLARIYYGDPGSATYWGGGLCLVTSGVTFVVVCYQCGPPFVASFWRGTIGDEVDARRDDSSASDR